jgi:hypothetical protein
MAITFGSGMLHKHDRLTKDEGEDQRPKTARYTKSFHNADLRKRENYFYQSINSSSVAYIPTVSHERPSVNQLHSTIPLNEKQKSLINQASKHLFASAIPRTELFKTINNAPRN